MSNYLCTSILVIAALLTTGSGQAATWVVHPGTHVPQGDPGFVEVMPAEDMDPAHPYPGSINWSASNVRFYPSWSWGTPMAGDYICWLYDSPTANIWWSGTFNQPSTSVHIQLINCDGNDGWVDIYVDGVLEYSYQTLNKGNVAIMGVGLPNVAHTVQLQTRLSTAAGAGDVSIDYVAQPAHPFDHKMHFEQWPDEDGWDVNATWPVVLADDWQCSETGPVMDIHFWGSWKYGIEGQIQGFDLSIHDDIPADPNTPGSYSHPGPERWHMYAEEFDFNQIDPPTDEGWYDPWLGDVWPNDHQSYFRYDVTNIPDPFVQHEGNIYWLNISAQVSTPEQWGWKSSENHWNDDAVWSTDPDFDWVDLYEPVMPVNDDWWVEVDEAGNFVGGGGSGFDGGAWYYYDETGQAWWNEWFYDHPYDPLATKFVEIMFNAMPMNPQQPSWLLLAVNWSTPEWSALGYGTAYPPIPGLPGFDELAHVGREILVNTAILDPSYFLTWTFPDYNPEWISIDVWGYNFILTDGFIHHTCTSVQSLDLAFVITGCGNQTRGDCDGSGTINGLDIDKFVDALVNPPLYNANYAPLRWECTADINCDGAMDGLDIDGFVQCLTGGCPPCP